MPPSERNGHATMSAVTRLTTQLGSITAAIEGGKSDTAITALLTELQRTCEEWTVQPSSASAKQWVSNLQTVIQTWKEIWPRMGGQREFRLAVARETRLWSQRLPTLV